MQQFLKKSDKLLYFANSTLQNDIKYAYTRVRASVFYKEKGITG